MTETNDHRVERDVLAELVFRGQCSGEGELRDADFTRPVHVAVLRALRAAWAAGEGKPALAEIRGHAQRLGEDIPPVVLAEIAEGIGCPGSFESSCRMLRSLACRRMLSRLPLALADNPDPEQAVARLESMLAEVRRNLPGGRKPISGVLTSLMESHQTHEDRLRTTFGALDDLVLGLAPGDLVVLGARPSVGKSAMALGVGLGVASQGVPVLFLSLEQTREAVLWRAIGNLSRGPILEMRADPTKWQQEIMGAAELLEAMPFRVIEPAWDIAAIEAMARSAAESGTRLLIVDYLQLVTAQARTEYEKVTQVSSRLKGIAKRNGIVVLACAQIARGVGKEQPTMAHLKGSGQIEQDADQVWLLHRENDRDGRPSGVSARLIVDKNRDGQTGSVSLDFYPHQTRFACPDGWRP